MARFSPARIFHELFGLVKRWRGCGDSPDYKLMQIATLLCVVAVAIGYEQLFTRALFTKKLFARAAKTGVQTVDIAVVQLALF